MFVETCFAESVLLMNNEYLGNGTKRIKLMC